MIAAGLDRQEGVGHRAARIVVAVDAQADTRKAGGQHVRDLIDRQGLGAAVGIAQAQHIRPALAGRLQHPHSIGRAVEVSVEEMLRVEDDLFAPFLKKAQGIAHTIKILLKGRLQYLRHVQVPALAENGHAGRVGRKQGMNPPVILGADTDAVRAAKGDQPGVFQPQPGRFLKEGRVLGVAAGVAGFDVFDAERVEGLHYLDLIGDREADAFRLRAVAQRGIKDFQIPG